jgi:hypothetical protein
MKGANLNQERNILLPMQLTVAHVGGRPGSKDEFDALTQIYLDRCSPFARCKTEAFRTEDALMEWLAKAAGPGAGGGRAAG